MSTGRATRPEEWKASCRPCTDTVSIPNTIIAMYSSQRVYEVRPRKDHRGVDLIPDVLPFGRLWYREPNAVSNAVDYAKFRSRSHNAPVNI